MSTAVSDTETQVKSDSNSDRRPSDDRRILVEQATAVREHLVAALAGLDQLIDDLRKAGKTELAEQAEAARDKAEQSADAFDANVAGRTADDIDPDTVRSTEQAAKEADDVTEQLRQLSERVDDLETHTNKGLAFVGVAFDDEGNPTYRKGGLVDTVNDHNRDLYGTEEDPGGLIADVAALKEAMPRDDEGNFVSVSTYVDNRQAQSTHGGGGLRGVGVSIAALLITFVVVWIIAGIIFGFTVGLVGWAAFIGILAMIVALVSKNKASDSTSDDRFGGEEEES